MSTFAGRYSEVLFKHVGNRVLPATSATVTVYESDGSTEASLYTSRTKATAAANPVSPDAAGNLEFFAAPGTYVLSVVEDGSVVATNTVTVHLDAEDESEGLVDSVNGATGAVVLGADDIAITDAGNHYSGSDVNAALQEIGSIRAPAPNGSDDTTALQALLDAAASAGGGEVKLRAGQYFATTLTIGSDVTLAGVSHWSSEIKQIASTNGHLVSLDAGTVVNATVRDLLLHGNNVNQVDANDLIHFDNTAGGSSTLARHRILNVHLRSAKNVGLYLGPFTRSTLVDGVNIYDADGVGMYLGGADSQISNVDVGQSGSHGVHVDGASHQIANVKSWYSGQSGSNGYGFLIAGSGNILVNCFSQENRQHGFILFRSGTVLTGNSLIGCNSDADGTAAGQAGFNLFNNTGTVVRGAVFKTSGLIGTPANGIQLDSSSTECDVVLTVSGNSSTDINTEANALDNHVILNGIRYPTSTGWTAFTNLVTDKTCDADTVAVAELADIVGTLIERLKAVGVIST